MYKRMKIIGAIFIILGMVLCAIWTLLQPVKIVGVYFQPRIADIVVEHFPITDSGRIQWWKDNEKQINEKFQLSGLEEKSDLKYITVWDLGSGFEAYNDRQSKFLDFDSNEQICFEQKLDKKRCIQKNILLIVLKSDDGKVSYTTDSAKYREENNKVIEGN